MIRHALTGMGLAALAMGAPLRAHAQQNETTQPPRITATYPTADSVQHAAVAEVRLRFSEAVRPTLTAITVLGPQGAVPPVAPVASVPGSDDTEVSVHFSPALPDGSYTVEWRTSAADDVVVRGSFAFSVSVQAPSGGAAQAAGSGTDTAAAERPEAGRSTSAGLGAGRVAMNWIFLLSIVGMVGTVGFRLGVAVPLGRKGGLGPVAARISSRLVPLAWVFAVLGLVSVPVRLVVRAEVGPEASLGAVLSGTWGSAWMLELASVALFLVALLLMGRESRPGPWLLALAAALLGSVVPGMSGHATSGGVALVAVNTVHVLAVGTWVGGLACLVLVGIPAASAAAPEASALAALAATFSRMSVPAVGLLVLSGILNASHHVGWGQLLTTPYGRLLCIKLGIVAGAFALAFYNWRMVRPALEGRPRSGLLSVPATVELVVALCVLAVTAALIVTSLP